MCKNYHFIAVGGIVSNNQSLVGAMTENYIAESKIEGYLTTNNFLENDNYRYFSLGKLTNKTDFKSIEKFIEQTVDRCSYNLNDYSSSVIEEYIKNKINQPDFNIVQEPVFCELIQVYKDGRLAIDDMVFSFLDEKFEKEF